MIKPTDMSDPNLVYDLADKLKAQGIFNWNEVEQFCTAFFIPNKRNAAISNICKPAVERWQKRYALAIDAYKTAKEKFERTKNTDDAVLIANAENSFKACKEEKDAWKSLRKTWAVLCASMSLCHRLSTMMTKLSLFTRHLRPMLREKLDQDDDVDLSNVTLSHYRLSKIRQKIYN